MGKSQRKKGQAGEREVAGILNDALGVNVSRNLDQARAGGCDLWLEVAGKPMALEVKRTERASFPAWIDQVGQVPAEYRSVIWRPSRHPWMVALSLDDFINIIREAGANNMPGAEVGK